MNDYSSRVKVRLWAASLVAGATIMANGADAPAPASEVEELRQMIQETRRVYEQRIRELELKLEALADRTTTKAPPTVPPLEAEPSLDDILGELRGRPEPPAIDTMPPGPEHLPGTAEEIARTVGQHDGPRLPWFRSLHNPSIGVVADVLARASDERQAFHRQNRLDLRELELILYGPIDPFGHASALISGSDGVSIEEAALTLTALPGNLQLRGGKFYPDVSRLNKTHTHDLPFVEQPLTMQNFLGRLDPLDQRAWWVAEPQFNAAGAELTWLAPSPFYWRWQLSIYNEFSDRSPGSFYDQYLGGPGFQRADRGIDDFTYHLGTRAFFELTPNHSLRLFANALIDSPGREARRLTENAGFTYLWFPLEGGLYRRMEWTTELFANQERFLSLIPEQRSWGIHSYVLRQLGRSFDTGLLAEYSTFRFDDSAGAWRAGTWLSYRLSERQRFRFQIDRFHTQNWLDSMARQSGVRAGDGNHWLFSLQWSVVLGSHEHTYE
jgi:hypothetical protein